MFGPSGDRLLTRRIADGSSSGSAVAVSANVVPLAFGTETGEPMSFDNTFCVGELSKHSSIFRSHRLRCRSSHFVCPR